jgi:hypothetical protein
MSEPALHADLEALTGLLGTWRGDGVGEYPTIADFAYTEEVTFGHVGKPFLTYGQRTRATDDGRPLHAETGYWRAPAAGRVELVLAHPTGVTEIATGTVTQVDDPEGATLVIELVSTAVGLSPTAKSVVGVERTFRLRAETLDYTLRMAAVDQPMQHHLAASLRRLSAP